MTITKELEELMEVLPTPSLILRKRQILYVNSEFFHYAECDQKIDYSHPRSFLYKFLSKNDFRKLLRKILGYPDDPIIEFYTAKRKKRFVKVFAKTFMDNDHKPLILIQFTDVTFLHVRAKTFQAGYDEFLHVSVKLEEAIKTIQKQNKLLEKQKATLEDELKIAQVLQKSIFDRNFDCFQNAKVAGYYQTMDKLGGDMWEFYEKDQWFFAIVGDVMGHGVAASLISIVAKTLFQKYFETLSLDQISVANLFRMVNEDLVQITGQNYYLTASLIAMDRNGRLHYATAGHPPILLVHPDGSYEELITNQPMLGIFRGVHFTENQKNLDVGDRLLLYTDGLIEPKDDLAKTIPLAKISAVLAKPISLADTIISLLNLHKAYTDQDSIRDDIAFCAVERIS